MPFSTRRKEGEISVARSCVEGDLLEKTKLAGLFWLGAQEEPGGATVDLSSPESLNRHPAVST